MKGSEEVDKTKKSEPQSQKDDNGSIEEINIIKSIAFEVSLRRSDDDKDNGKREDEKNNVRK